ncbi:low molecular weight phosphotyrosine protein phosphatase [Corynebacterium felinum]|uniref:protein-tyrosine-phosphatase n=1 Tax=Corynebacterium felinum TaxID=131318 RepID=A0ABU2BEW3_9CORY|nr:low molecular weight protein-tyrosine-phosphatase [Corynebacterium felinum]MDF5821204.1 low molecular weight phosphotyrosine protein phosphatase [Corynebacterium felinum]MDR7356278.1 protein-tyrosine phosphatase [Corynebacterium felinum]WJY95611.1 putative low molecular weight protein-tyrosine-phosphatase [Corynebacterium felinum]
MTLRITVVCTGNICRSPMGDVIINHAITQAGLDHLVSVDSCGTGGWHVGEKADRRAITELAKAGYDGSAHRAAQLCDDHASADLIIAMDRGHEQALLRYGIPATKIRLLRSFDPLATSDDVEDPYYGYASDFEVTRVHIEAAVPGIMEWITTALNLKERG